MMKCDDSDIDSYDCGYEGDDSTTDIDDKDVSS